MEKLLIGKDIGDNEVIYCGYDTVNNRYNIGYKCKGCGNEKVIHMTSDKVSLLGCKICNKRVYISPIKSTSIPDKIVGYYVIDSNTYRKIRKQHKLDNNTLDIVTYIDMINKGNV